MIEDLWKQMTEVPAEEGRVGDFEMRICVDEHRRRNYSESTGCGFSTGIMYFSGLFAIIAP